MAYSRSRSRRRKLSLESLLMRVPPFNWRVAKCLLELRAEANEAWPHRSKASDGTIGDAGHETRDSDHNAWVRDGLMGVVTALDLTHDPANGCDAQRIVDALVELRDPRIKYIIWNRRIINSRVAPWVWRSYSGDNPHDKHFHLSVLPDKPFYDDQRSWNIAAAVAGM